MIEAREQRVGQDPKASGVARPIDVEHGTGNLLLYRKRLDLGEAVALSLDCADEVSERGAGASGVDREHRSINYAFAVELAAWECVVLDLDACSACLEVLVVSCDWRVIE
jgi:hypothetical protein